MRFSGGSFLRHLSSRRPTWAAGTVKHGEKEILGGNGEVGISLGDLERVRRWVGECRCLENNESVQEIEVCVCM